MRTLLPAVLGLFVFGCNSGGGNASLSSLTTVGPDSTCPAGGVKLSVGPDKNGNGKLDADEVKQTQEICNGANGANGMNGMNGQPGADGGNGANGVATLVNATTLLAGDLHCPTGGQQLDFGLDDGSGGGVAGNGVLEAGEVLSTRYVCNGSIPYFPADVTPPTGAGAYSIHARGGAGSNGAGGPGGQLQMHLQPGSLGGAVAIFDTGAADAGFTLPAAPAFHAGAVPMLVNSDYVLNAYPSVQTGLASGDPFFHVEFDGHVWANSAGDAGEVTSIEITQGKTLTVAVSPNEGAMVVAVRDDVHNAGKVQLGTLSDGVSAASLSLSASNFYGDVGSSLVATGASTDGGTPGGAGGVLQLQIGAQIINQGAIDTSAGNGSDASQAGSVYLMSGYGRIYNTGAITAHGGNGLTGNGGGGALISLSGFAGTYNSGTLDVSGGQGVFNGGSGGQVNLEVTALGRLKSAGAIKALGGSCTNPSCAGSNGGNVFIHARSSDLDHNAPIDVSGGDGTAEGGNSGNIELRCDEWSSYSERVTLPAGELNVSGNLTANGGKGQPGGSGGFLTVALNPFNVPQGQSARLLGYTDLDLSGGAGDVGSGGQGGIVNVTSAASFPPVGEGAGGAPSGPALNYAKVTSRGGDGTFGGGGGQFVLDSELDFDFHQPLDLAANYGDVDVSAGVSTNTFGNGAGGFISIEGTGSATNKGKLTAKGSTSSGGPINAGTGGNIQLLGDDGPVDNSGACDASGGSGSQNGGLGGSMLFAGTLVTNSASLTANGGNGAFAGGNGGQITLTSNPGATANTGTFSAAGGSGMPPGAKGQVLVDGVDVTP